MKNYLFTEAELDSLLTSLKSISSGASGAISTARDLLKMIDAGPLERAGRLLFWEICGPAFKLDPKGFMNTWLKSASYEGGLELQTIKFAEKHADMLAEGRKHVQEIVITTDLVSKLDGVDSIHEFQAPAQLKPEDLMPAAPAGLDTPVFAAPPAQAPETVSTAAPTAATFTQDLAPPPVLPFQLTPVAIDGSGSQNGKTFVQHPDEGHYRPAHKQLLPLGPKDDHDALLGRRS